VELDDGWDVGGGFAGKVPAATFVGEMFYPQVRM
jgi:hypothetical protein